MKRTGKFITEYADKITINANDMFGPRSESVDIDIFDVPKLVEMERKYGHDGVVAFLSKVTESTPEVNSSNYNLAKEELEKYTLFQYEEISDTQRQVSTWRSPFYD